MSFTDSVVDIIEKNANGLLATHPSWTRVPLNWVFDVQNGFPFESGRFNQAGRGVPLLRIRDIVNGRTETFYDGPFDPGYLVQPGDVVIGMDGDFNVRRWRGAPALLNQRVCRLVPKGPYPKEFVPLVLQGYLDAINAYTPSITVKHLSSRTVEEILLPLPPEAELQRLRDAIESHLSRIEAGLASLEGVSAKLKAYRASVLKAAVEGRLVPTEAELARADRRDYESGEVVVKRILAERRRQREQAESARMKAKKRPRSPKSPEQYDEPQRIESRSLPTLPEGWCWTTVDAVLTKIETGKNFACEERPPRNEEVGVVKVSAVTWGTFDELESKTCTRPELIDESTFIQPGDFLFSRANTVDLVGACVIVDRCSLTLMLSDKILRLRIIEGLAPWVLWCLRSPFGRRQIENASTGNQESMRNISQASIRGLPIPMPPAGERERIVEAVEMLTANATRTENEASRSISRVIRLRQSILRWAFEGKLVDQDSNDQPAEHLLARIRAERAADTTSKTRTRKAKAS